MWAHWGSEQQEELWCQVTHHTFQLAGGDCHTHQCVVGWTILCETSPFHSGMCRLHHAHTRKDTNEKLAWERLSYVPLSNYKSTVHNSDFLYFTSIHLLLWLYGKLLPQWSSNPYSKTSLMSFSSTVHKHTCNASFFKAASSCIPLMSSTARPTYVGFVTWDTLILPNDLTWG